MGTSTLDPDNIPEPDRQLGKGHGTGALGPNDISDSGSDMQGGTRRVEEFDIGLDRGTHEDPDLGQRNISADSGDDAGSYTDTDSQGTGERGTVGTDSDVEMGGDIDVDRIDQASAGEDLDLDDANLPPPRSRHPGRPQQRR